jgi:hypothetical protein
VDPARIEELLARSIPSARAGTLVLSRFVGNAYFSVSKSNKPCVVFILDDDPQPNRRVLRAIEVTIHSSASVSIRGKTRRAAIAVVELADLDRLKLYCLLLSDLADGLTDSAVSFVTAQQVLDKIDSWREAFQGGKDLTPNEEVGLWGELEVLERIGLSDAALRSWHGPEASKFDFAANGINLEVKTSFRPHVHEFSQEQLVPPGISELYVASLRIRDDYATGESLSEKADRIASRFRAPGPFRRKLAAAGLDPSVRLSRQFALVELRLVEGARVPTVREIDPGVTSIKFTSDLAGVSSIRQTRIRHVFRVLGTPPKTPTHKTYATRTRTHAESRYSTRHDKPILPGSRPASRKK